MSKCETSETINSIINYYYLYTILYLLTTYKRNKNNLHKDLSSDFLVLTNKDKR